MSQNQHKAIHKIRQFLDIIILLILAATHTFSPEPMLKVVLGLLFFFLPGYSVTRFVLRNRKKDFTTPIIYTVLLSFCVLPLIGNLVQIVTLLSFYSILLAVLVFSLPLLYFCDKNPPVRKEEQDINGEETLFYLGMAFFGSIAVGVGLYVQAALGVVAPRGYDIYEHMYVANGIISTGRLVFQPNINVMSNFHHFLYAELSLLTGLDLLTTGIVAQTLMGAVFSMSMFYFARYVTGSLTASFTSAVLFIAGPPIYSVGLKSYFWYFHPMWVALSIFPFALAYVHENILNNKNKSASLAPILIVALFLYHLAVGLMFVSIIAFDFLLLLLRFRKKFLFVNFGEMAVLTVCLSSVVTIPFLINVTNPFKYVYPESGLQTLYNMFFGYSKYLWTSPQKGWDFFADVFSRFSREILPLVIIGVPGLVYLFRRRSASFILILSCVLTALIGLFQPLLGLSFMPQRFNGLLIMFGSTLVGASLSLLASFPHIRFRKRGKSIKVKVGLSKRSSSSLALLLLTFSFLFLYSYIVFFSPARGAVLAADLEIHEDDLTMIQWLDENIPRDRKILMDQYFQFFFVTITGREPLFSITSEESLWQLWNVYPVNVYIGQSDPLEVDVDYIVISPFCFTTTPFVGKEYFDQHEGLVNIHELKVSHYVPTQRTPYYAVYEVTR